jgi:ubiquitin C-terminal hydrolase
MPTSSVVTGELSKDYSKDLQEILSAQTMVALSLQGEIDSNNEDVQLNIALIESRISGYEKMGEGFLDDEQKALLGEVKNKQAALLALISDLGPIDSVGYESDEGDYESKSSTPPSSARTVGGAVTRTSALAPGGISQGGNTCYLATAMQQIANEDLFFEKFNPKVNTYPASSGDKKLRDLQARGFEILKKVHAGTTVSGREIHQFRIQMLLCGCYAFLDGNVGGQKDSQVVFNWLLEVLISNTSNEKCLLESSTLETLDKSKRSVKITPDWGLQLPIGKEIKSVGEALQAYVSPEVLRRGDWYDFKDGKGKVAVTKQLKLSQYPKVLVLNMKRFEYDAMGRKLKITKSVEAPELLKLDKRFVVDTQESDSAKYELTGFSQHRGGAKGGHYVSYIKKSGQWFCANDSRVRRIDSKSKAFIEAKNAAYGLTYKCMQA